jgi:hypothetical protein
MALFLSHQPRNTHLEVANDEIRSVWRDLEEARDHWRHEVEIRNAMLQECHRAAMRAQEEGGGVDCSPYLYALQEAEHRLDASSTRNINSSRPSKRIRQ